MNVPEGRTFDDRMQAWAGEFESEIKFLDGWIRKLSQRRTTLLTLRSEITGYLDRNTVHVPDLVEEAHKANGVPEIAPAPVERHVALDPPVIDDHGERPATLRQQIGATLRSCGPMTAKRLHAEIARRYPERSDVPQSSIGGQLARHPEYKVIRQADGPQLYALREDEA